MSSTTIKISTKNENNISPVLTIPAGTEIRPTRRSTGNYFMTLIHDTEISLDNLAITVMIKGVQFDITNNLNEDTCKKKVSEDNSSNNDPNAHHECCSCQCVQCINKLLREVEIQKGTEYFINDPVIDPIGLKNIILIDDKFQIKPGSTVILPSGTELILRNNIPCPPPVNGIVEHKNNTSMTLTKNTYCQI